MREVSLMLALVNALRYTIPTKLRREIEAALQELKG